MKKNDIKVQLYLKDWSKVPFAFEYPQYIAYVYKKTKSGHVIMIYETHASPIVAKNRLLVLLG